MGETKERRQTPARGTYVMGVDAHSSIPISRQLADQVRYLVQSEQLIAGTRLPSARQLADNLNIHRNTVRKAYLELGRDGLIVSRGSLGTFVTGDRSPTSSDPGPLFEIIRRLIQEADRAGVSPSELASIVFSQTMAHRGARRGSIVFIECNPASLEHYRQEIARTVGVDVEPLLLDDVESWTVPTPAPRAVVTTFFHYADVRRRLRQNDQLAQQELVAINVRPHLEVLRRLNELPGGTRLGVAYVQGDPYASPRLRRMHEAISHAHLVNVETVPVALTTNPTPEDFAGLSAVLVRPENIAQWRNSIPPNVIVIEFLNALDEGSVHLLREILAEPSEPIPAVENPRAIESHLPARSRPERPTRLRRPAQNRPQDV